MDKKRNKEVLDKLGVTAPVLMSQIRRRRLRYYGHIARGGSLENDIAEGMVPGKRSRGRPVSHARSSPMPDHPPSASTECFSTGEL